MASGKEETARPADIISPTNDSALPTRVIVQNFWNNANRHVVPDPFKMVK